MIKGFRGFVVCLFVFGVLYHFGWIFLTSELYSKRLSYPVHVFFLYVFPLICAFVMALFTGKVGGNGLGRVAGAFLIFFLGLIVPFLALQFVSAVMCLTTSKCL